jgi:CheY-like chemotaxis protein
MDLIMPVKNGYEASEKIRSLEAENMFPKTFICAFSAEVKESKINLNPLDTIQKCYSHGINDIVSKPLKVALLREMLLNIQNKFND